MTKYTSHLIRDVVPSYEAHPQKYTHSFSVIHKIKGGLKRAGAVAQNIKLEDSRKQYAEHVDFCARFTKDD